RVTLLANVEDELLDADILISSTSSNTYVIDKEMMDRVSAKRGKESLIMIDIAMPRDIDPSISESDTIYIYNVDDLQGLVDANLKTREKEAEKIMYLIDSSRNDFEEWLNLYSIVVVIHAVSST